MDPVLPLDVGRMLADYERRIKDLENRRYRPTDRLSDLWDVSIDQSGGPWAPGEGDALVWDEELGTAASPEGRWRPGPAGGGGGHRAATFRVVQSWSGGSPTGAPFVQWPPVGEGVPAPVIASGTDGEIFWPGPKDGEAGEIWCVTATASDPNAAVYLQCGTYIEVDGGPAGLASAWGTGSVAEHFAVANWGGGGRAAVWLTVPSASCDVEVSGHWVRDAVVTPGGL